jgi:hypothetical protein
MRPLLAGYEGIQQKKIFGVHFAISQSFQPVVFWNSSMLVLLLLL